MRRVYLSSPSALRSGKRVLRQQFLICIYVACKKRCIPMRNTKPLVRDNVAPSFLNASSISSICMKNVLYLFPFDCASQACLGSWIQPTQCIGNLLLTPPSLRFLSRASSSSPRDRSRSELTTRCLSSLMYKWYSGNFHRRYKR